MTAQHCSFIYRIQQIRDNVSACVFSKPLIDLDNKTSRFGERLQRLLASHVWTRDESSDFYGFKFLHEQPCLFPARLNKWALRIVVIPVFSTACFCVAY
jgi:hypothetical protein